MYVSKYVTQFHTLKILHFDINHTVLFAALPARSACCYRTQIFPLGSNRCLMKCHHFTVVTREFGALYRYEDKYSQSEAICRLSQCLHYVASAIMSKAVGKIYVIKYFGNLKFSFWSFVQCKKLCTLLKIFFLVSIKVLLVRWRICLQIMISPLKM